MPGVQIQSTGSSTAVKPQKNYGKVILTLYNRLLPEGVLKETPSRADGLDIETEIDLRSLGCELIQTAGILLKMPQVVMATGQIYFQRFYYAKSFIRYPVEAMAMGSIYLASKVEERPCRIDDVINVFHHIKQVKTQKIISPLILDQNYVALRSQVIKAERRILKELGFCVYTKHPHKLMLIYLQLLQQEKNRQLMQKAWNYMNDTFRTDVFMRFPPETIACACIYLTARKISLPLPNSPHWFLLFNVTEEDIREVCSRILQLYKRPKVNSDQLQKKLDGLRKIYQAKTHCQAQKERVAKAEEKKVVSPGPVIASITTVTKKDSRKYMSSKTTPLNRSSHKSKRDRSRSPHNRQSKRDRSRSPYDRQTKRDRSRSPHDRKREHSNKRYKLRSQDIELDRSRERRSGGKRSRGSGSRTYDDESRRDSRDYKRKY